MALFFGLLIPLLGTMLGSAFVFLMKDEMSPRIQKSLLGFASGVMVAASVWSLIIPAMEMEEAGFTKADAEEIYRKVKDYDELRHALMQRSGDYVDMKLYDAQMRSLLDRYIIAPRSEKLAELDDFSFLDIININEVTGEADIDANAEQELGGQRGVAETMTANVRRVVNRKREQNPEEYRRFSDRINRLLEELRQGVIEYKEFLKQIKQIGEELKHQNAIDPRLDSAAKKDLCDNLGGNVELTLQVYNVAKQFAQPRFRQNKQIKK